MTKRDDTGDFYLVVREPGSKKNIIEKDIAYKERSFKVRQLPKSENVYELCILARDSVGNVKNFISSQCRILDSHAFALANKMTITKRLLMSFFFILYNLK